MSSTFRTKVQKVGEIEKRLRKEASIQKVAQGQLSPETLNAIIDADEISGQIKEAVIALKVKYPEKSEMEIFEAVNEAVGDGPMGGYGDVKTTIEYGEQNLLGEEGFEEEASKQKKQAVLPDNPISFEEEIPSPEELEEAKQGGDVIRTSSKDYKVGNWQGGRKKKAQGQGLGERLVILVAGLEGEIYLKRLSGRGEGEILHTWKMVDDSIDTWGERYAQQWEVKEA